MIYKTQNLFGNSWIYENTENNKARFILGEPGKKTLACIGVNPSTAEPNNLDNTLTCVRRFAYGFGYDSWIMLNLYPQRATCPDDLHDRCDFELHKENLRNLENLLAMYKMDFWAAWGTLIEKRPYLKDCLFDMYEILNKFESNWYTIGRRSKAGHPHHPLYLRKTYGLDNFDIEKYIKDTI